nr:bidirectional sugar transporter SWEET5-like [Ipomoea batatas]
MQLFQKKIVIALIVEAIFFAAIVTVTLTVLHGTKKRSALIGIVCIVFNVLMYTSPLTVMKRVITTKSVKYMPFYLSLANFANGCVWFCYAFIKFDPYVLVESNRVVSIVVVEAILVLGHDINSAIKPSGPLVMKLLSYLLLSQFTTSPNVGSIYNVDQLPNKQARLRHNAYRLQNHFIATTKSSSETTSFCYIADLRSDLHCISVTSRGSRAINFIISASNLFMAAAGKKTGTTTPSSPSLFR